MTDPAFPYFFRNQFGQPGIAPGHPPPQRHPVGDVEKFLRIELVKIPQDRLLEQFGVQFSHTVHRPTAYEGQVGHADIFWPGFIDQGEAGRPLFIQRIFQPDLIQEAAVDFKNDLQVAGEQFPEKRQGPFFQGLGKQGMVGVSEGFLSGFPGRLPSHQMLVDQQPHQLGHGDGRMGVVELDRKGLVKPLGRQPFHFVQPEHVLQ